ncbi:transporter substrate-binding domain-containing protein [Lysinibacillus sp. Bpr_S20]|uniref:transporter substrate-binding domain-containing protein n=1 Tax=Lysinibacillus sp. Bpr_S20 TaxID=2933964 RepID=UPI0020136020|nr:transporter substrate-binding domain-containing protein [Lysinibacillus sp. Bpr_S20]MCL1702461.1 transporter substrate-binding domain-containing protein [Lysinibacillus sp. Bpr_S20]
MKKYLCIFMLILVAVLSACGSNENANVKDALEKIKKDGVIKVGIEGAYPPFNFYNTKNELEGFDVDITNEIGKRMGVNVEFVATPWDSIIGGLLSKKYEIIISSMAITEDRKKKVDFTEPYYYTGAQLFTKSNSNIKNVETDVKGKKIGVVTGTTFTDEVIRLGGEPVLYKSDLLSFQDLVNGRVDGAITDKAVGGNIILENGYDVIQVGNVLYDETAGITVNKNQEGLVNEINKHIKDMVKDGTYDEISKKWFGRSIYK